MSFGGGMKIHKREERVTKAELELRSFINGLSDKHDLTTAEYMRVLNTAFGQMFGSVIKFWIREERHGDADKPGGIE